jgi:hypothetical protein
MCMNFSATCLRVVSGKPNHKLDKVLDGHLMVGCLKPKEKAVV